MPEIKNRKGRNNNRSRSNRDFEKYNPRTDSTYGGSKANSRRNSKRETLEANSLISS